MHEATRRLLGVLLRHLDGFETNKRSVVIAATNRKEDLDPALLSRCAWPLSTCCLLGPAVLWLATLPSVCVCLCSPIGCHCNSGDRQLVEGKCGS